MKSRILQIIKILISNNKVLTISQISKKVNASNKTIRNDLVFIQKLFGENNLKLVKKTGIGIYVEGTEQAKLNMLSMLKNYKSTGSQYTSGDRQLYILNQLLTNKKMVTINSLQNELFISRPSVYKDLERVKTWLANRDIELNYDKKNGFSLESGEKRIRKAMYDFFSSSEEYDRVMKIMEKFQESQKGYAATNFFSYEQKDDFLDIDLNTVGSIIINLEDKLNIKFTMDDFAKLTIKYAISISRIKKGCFVTMKETTIKDLQALDNFYSIEELRNQIKTVFNIKEVPLEELAYLFGITIVSKTHFEDISWNVNKKTMVVNKILAQEIIELTKESYHIDDEISFYNGLVHHLKSVTNKIKYNLEFYNENIDEIKNNYPDAFAIAQQSTSIFKYFYDKQIPLAEISYIALHIAAAIERSKHPLKTYVVYHNSYSQIKLLIEFLKNNFNQLNIIKVFPISMLNQVDDKDIELLISTKKIKEETTFPSIVLPTVLSQSEIITFGQYIMRLYEESNAKRLRRMP